MFVPSQYSYGSMEPFGAHKTKKKGKHKHPKELDAFDFGPPDRLWMTPPKKRKVDVSGVFSPEDTMIAVAKGAQPSFATADLDRRATIVGGIVALKAKGVQPYAKVNVKVLHALTAQSKAEDKKLLHAAGAKSLEKAAQKVRKAVHEHHLDGLAWDYRALAILGGMKGATLAHSAAAAILAVAFPPAGAAAGAHVAITQGIAKKYAATLQADIKRRLHDAGVQTAGEEDTLEAQPPAAADTGILSRPYLLGGLAVLAAGGAYLLARRVP